MKTKLTALILMFATTGSAFADDCAEKFTNIVIFSEGRTYDGPTTALITQKIKNAPPSKNYHYHIDSQNWMTEMIEPPTAPWSLARNNILYSSMDQGKSWQKVRELDPVPPADPKNPQQQARAETVRNTACQTEDHNGEMLETYRGEYDMLGGMEGSIDEKMWLAPDHTWVKKSETHLKMGDFESTTVQLIEQTPDLELPTPE